MKIYKIGNCSEEFKTVKEAKRFALRYYGCGVEYVLHYGIKKDGDSNFNAGKKFNTGK